MQLKSLKKDKKTPKAERIITNKRKEADARLNQINREINIIRRDNEIEKKGGRNLNTKEHKVELKS